MKSTNKNAIFSAAKLIKVAKLFSNPKALLDSLNAVAFMDTYLEWTNLETSITIPYKSGVKAYLDNAYFVNALQIMPTPSIKDTVTKTKKWNARLEKDETEENHRLSISEGTRLVTVPGGSLNNFPKTLTGSPVVTGWFTADLLPILKKSLLFQSDDDLRPSMTYTEVHDHIVATDGHKLLFVKLDKPLETPIYLHRKVINLLEVFGGEWEVQLLTKKGDNGAAENIGIRLTNIDDVRITQRYPDFKFPEWTKVLPEITEDSPAATLNKKELQTAVKEGRAFANQSTRQGILKLGESSSWSTQDVDFESTYSTGLTATRSVDMSIGLNGDLLSEVLATLPDGDFKIRYWTPDKAVIFNDDILLMPMHLNK